MGEDRQTRIRRLTMRSMRRGIKEMDVILENFARDELAGLDEEALDRYERMLEHSDHDIYGWIAGRDDPPPDCAELIERIRRHVSARFG